MHFKYKRSVEEDANKRKGPEATVHWKATTSGAMLPHNHSLLADLGSFIKVIGRNTMNILTETSEAHGQDVKFVPRKKIV